MNLFLSSVMFSVKKVSFPAKTAVFPSQMLAAIKLFRQPGIYLAKHLR